MASLLSRFFGLHDPRRDSRFDVRDTPILPTPDTHPIPSRRLQNPVATPCHH